MTTQKTPDANLAQLLERISPLPWHPSLQGPAANPDWISVHNRTGKWALATLSWPAGIERTEVEANAEYITKACNAFPALVKALAEMERAVDGATFLIHRPDQETAWLEVQDARKEARSLLAQLNSKG